MAAVPTQQVEFGDSTVHYSAFSSAYLSASVAAQANLTRGRHVGVLTVAVVRNGLARPALLSGAVQGPQGRPRPLSFRQVNAAGAASYVAQFAIERPETLTFTLMYDDGNARHPFRFNQELFPGP